MQYNITYRKKDNSYQYIISYKNSRGKWRQKSKQGYPLTRQGKKDCKDASIEALEQLKLKAQNNINDNYSQITFKEYFNLFIEHEKLYKAPNTIYNNRTAFNQFSSLHDLKLAEITTMQIQMSLDDLISKGVKLSSANTYLTVIKKLFNAATTQYKILITNPASDIKLLVDKSVSKKKALTNKEVNDLLSKIKNKNYYLMSLLAVKCGLRIGEITGLKWSDINKGKKILVINKQWKNLSNNKKGLGDVKGKNSNRIIPVPPIVMNELKKYKSTHPISIDGRIFSEKFISSLSGQLSHTYKKCGYDITIHELRHTYATTLIANGLDFKTVANLMGHDVKETLRTYSHVTSDMFEHATEIINTIL